MDNIIRKLLITWNGREIKTNLCTILNRNYYIYMKLDLAFSITPSCLTGSVCCVWGLIYQKDHDWVSSLELQVSVTDSCWHCVIYQAITLQSQHCDKSRCVCKQYSSLGDGSPVQSHSSHKKAICWHPPHSYSFQVNIGHQLFVGK